MRNIISTCATVNFNACTCISDIIVSFKCANCCFIKRVDNIICARRADNVKSIYNRRLQITITQFVVNSLVGSILKRNSAVSNSKDNIIAAGRRIAYATSSDIKRGISKTVNDIISVAISILNQVCISIVVNGIVASSADDCILTAENANNIIICASVKF